jgi:uncharacterized membrane protein YoaK (UPF0700 family)
VNWLVASLILSVVLTVVANVALRMFPNAGDRMARGIENMAARREDPDDDRNVRVIVPWKAMVIGSIVLTILLNVIIRLR